MPCTVRATPSSHHFGRQVAVSGKRKKKTPPKCSLRTRPRRREDNPTQQQVSKASSISSRFARFAPRLTCPICELRRRWTNYRQCHIHSNVPMLTVGARKSTKCTSAQELRVPAAGPGVSRPPLEACLPRTSLRTIHRTRGWTKPNASAWRVARLTHLAIGCLLAGSRPVEDAGPLLKCPDRPLDQTPYRGSPTAPPAASLPPLAVQRAASQMIFSFPSPARHLPPPPIQSHASGLHFNQHAMQPALSVFGPSGRDGLSPRQLDLLAPLSPSSPTTSSPLCAPGPVGTHNPWCAPTM